MGTPCGSKIALVLPGAVAKGAFEAGVISVIADRKIPVERIVGTSSGALNGLAYAYGIATGSEKEVSERLIEAWVNRGAWTQSFNLKPLNWILGRGLSDQKGLRQLIEDVIPAKVQSAKFPVQFRVIVTPLNGVMGAIAKRKATTYEQLLHFSEEDFGTTTRRDEMIQAVLAACAFPGVFEPVEIAGLGPCIDGGTVNNAPIKYALDEGDVAKVIMPVPFPELMEPGPRLGGFALLNHLIEILINERLYRDLKDAQVVNREVAKLEALHKDGTLTDDQIKAVLRVLSVRDVEICEVRPSMPLEANPFSGFFSKAERIRLVDEGRKAAELALKV